MKQVKRIKESTKVVNKKVRVNKYVNKNLKCINH